MPVRAMHQARRQQPKVGAVHRLQRLVAHAHLRRRDGRAVGRRQGACAAREGCHGAGQRGHGLGLPDVLPAEEGSPLRRLGIGIGCASAVPLVVVVIRLSHVALKVSLMTSRQGPHRTSSGGTRGAKQRTTSAGGARGAIGTLEQHLHGDSSWTRHTCPDTPTHPL